MKSLTMIVCAVAASLCGLALPAVAQNVQSIAATAGRSVCIVLAEGGSGTTSGTGFVVADGFILTADHVVQNAGRLRVLCPDHPSIEVKMANADADKDVALLSNPLLSIRPLPLGESARVQAGQAVVVIGFPRADLLGAETATVTQGTVSSTGSGAVQIQAPVGPGNSGSPVLSMQGQVIGVVRAVLGSQMGSNFATSFATGIDAVKPFLTSTLRNLAPPRAPGSSGGVGAGSAANAGRIGPSVPSAPSPASGPSNFVITPGRSIGDLKMGMTREQLEAVLGPAKQVYRRQDGGFGINWFVYYSQNDVRRGFWAIVSSSGDVVMIGVLNDPRFALPAQGLHHGSTENDVRAVLGEPSRVETDQNNKLLYYDSLGLRFTIVNNHNWALFGLVHEIAVYRPT